MSRAVGILLGFLAPLCAASAGEREQADLAHKAKAILKANCHRCHGQDGANEGGFNFVLDARQLVNRRKVVPGDPAKSRMLRRIADPDDPMPPADEKVRPSKDDIVLLRRWIEAGAPAFDAVPKAPSLPRP